MNTADLNAAIAAGQFKVTRLPSVAPKRHQLVMTRVGGSSASYALPSYKSVRDSSRSTRDTVEMGKRATRSANRRLK